MLKRLLDPKTVMFCVAVANMVQVWSRVHDAWRFEPNLFFSSLVLLSTLLLFIKRLWSNFLATVLTGLLPVFSVFAFVMTARDAEVSLFGWDHIKLVAKFVMRMPGIFLLLSVLSVSILAYAYYSLAQLVAQGKVRASDDV